MDFADLHVVVTGGTGALGHAVVAALIEAGATCHIPYRSESEAERFPFRDHAQAKLYPNSELGDERSVDRLFERIPTLWASIHLAGSFAFGSHRDLTEATLRRQIETNLVTCALCCRGALRAFARSGQGGRIVNVAARPALEWRTGSNMAAYAASKSAVAALTVALAEEVAKEGVPTRWRPRSWTRRRTAWICRKPISQPGPRSRRSPAQSSFSRRPPTR